MAMVEGQYTSTVYSLIKESRLSEAIDCLEPILEVCIFCTRSQLPASVACSLI